MNKQQFDVIQTLLNSQLIGEEELLEYLYLDNYPVEYVFNKIKEKYDYHIPLEFFPELNRSNG